MTADNLKEAVGRGLAGAEALCAKRGARLTRLRRKVLECLLASAQPVKAYDLIEKLRDRGERPTPATIYRTLDFLLHCGLAHRIASINAYVPCTCEHRDNSLLLFVCSQCRQAKEIDDPVLYGLMRSRLSELGMALEGNSIEMRGLCNRCAEQT